MHKGKNEKNESCDDESFCTVLTIVYSKEKETTIPIPTLWSATADGSLLYSSSVIDPIDPIVPVAR